MKLVEDRTVRQVRIIANPRDPKDLESAQNKLRVTYGQGKFLFSSTELQDGNVLISALSA